MIVFPWFPESDLLLRSFRQNEEGLRRSPMVLLYRLERTGILILQRVSAMLVNSSQAAHCCPMKQLQTNHQTQHDTAE